MDKEWARSGLGDCLSQSYNLKYEEIKKHVIKENEKNLGNLFGRLLPNWCHFLNHLNNFFLSFLIQSLYRLKIPKVLKIQSILFNHKCNVLLDGFFFFFLLMLTVDAITISLWTRQTKILPLSDTDCKNFSIRILI